MSTGQIISKDSSNSAAKISVDGTHQLHQIISGIAKTDSVLKSGDTTAIADSGKTASDSASAVATFRFVDEENTDLTANEISFLPSSSYLGSHVLNVHSRSPVSYSKPVARLVCNSFIGAHSRNYGDKSFLPQYIQAND